MDKKQLSERDVCTKFITPAVKQAGWDEMLQIREEVSFTKGRISSPGTRRGITWYPLVDNI
jgi:type I restriction enzyme, R subunit